jgi:hypothetical protein
MSGEPILGLAGLQALFFTNLAAELAHAQDARKETHAPYKVHLLSHVLSPFRVFRVFRGSLPRIFRNVEMRKEIHAHFRT